MCVCIILHRFMHAHKIKSKAAVTAVEIQAGWQKLQYREKELCFSLPWSVSMVRKLLEKRQSNETTQVHSESDCSTKEVCKHTDGFSAASCMENSVCCSCAVFSPTSSQTPAQIVALTYWATPNSHLLLFHLVSLIILLVEEPSVPSALASLPTLPVRSWERTVCVSISSQQTRLHGWTQLWSKLNSLRSLPLTDLNPRTWCEESELVVTKNQPH